jgi:signal transduction histidine kinase
MSTEVALLDKDLPKDELRAALQSNLEDIDKLTTLLNNLLRLSKLESEELRTAFTTFSASSIAKEALAQVARRAETKHITIRNEIKDDIVAGERESLIQLLIILIDNAVKYSHEHGTVLITSTHKDRTTTITVTDHGVGIEQDALTHVFDRFYRADTARTSNDGYGLGLSIAKQIADLHGATITLTSKLGKGTTARVLLPTEIVSQ